MLRHVMVQVVKGEAAMRVDIWRLAARLELDARAQLVQEALESQTKRSRNQGEAIRQMRQVMTRLAKGEVTM